MNLIKLNIQVTIIYYLQTFIYIVLKNNHQINKEMESIFILLVLLYLTLVSVVFNEKIFTLNKAGSIMDYAIRFGSIVCVYVEQIRTFLENYINISVILIIFLSFNAVIEFYLFQNRFLYESYKMDKTPIENKIKNEINHLFVYKNLKWLMGLIIISYGSSFWLVIGYQFLNSKIIFSILIVLISFFYFFIYLWKRRDFVQNLYKETYAREILRIEFKWLIIGSIYTAICLFWLIFISQSKNSISLILILPQILCTIATYQNIREIARLQVEGR